MFVTALFFFMLMPICLFRWETNDRPSFATFTCHLIIVFLDDNVCITCYAVSQRYTSITLLSR